MSAGRRPGEAARKLARKFAWATVTGALVVILAALATARHGDPALYPPTGRAVEVFVVSNGFHSGIAVPREALRELAERRGLPALTFVATRFAAYSWLEFGFGEEEFYRSVPTVGSLDLALASRALFRSGNAAALHVVGLLGLPPLAFPEAGIVRLELSEEGFARMADRLDAGFARAPSGLPAQELGPGLYGPSLFFRATGTFSAVNLCNHWVAGVLDTAGVPTTPVLDTLTQGLLIDLRWRAGATSATRPDAAR